MVQFVGTGITPVNIFTTVQSANSKGLVILFDLMSNEYRITNLTHYL